MKKLLILIAFLIGQVLYVNAQTNFSGSTPSGEIISFEIEETINPGDYNGGVFTMASRPNHYIDIQFNNEFGAGAFQLGIDGGTSTCDIIYFLCDLFGWNYPSNPC